MSGNAARTRIGPAAALLCGLLLAPVVTPPAAAQPMVSASPDPCYYGETLTVNGWFEPNKTRDPSQPPPPTIIELKFLYQEPATQAWSQRHKSEVTATADGAFTASFTKTTELGSWKVVASKKGAPGRAEAPFTVTIQLSFGGLAGSIGDFHAATTDFVRDTRASVVDYPVFPSKQVFLDDLDELAATLAALLAELDKLRDAGDKLNAAVANGWPNLSAPARHGLRDVQSSIDTATSGAAPRTAEIRRLHTASIQATMNCEEWKLDLEAFEAVNFFATFMADGLASLSANLASLGAGQVLDPISTMAAQALIATAAYTAAYLVGTTVVATLGPWAVIPGLAVGALAAVVTLISQHEIIIHTELLKNCTVFEGKAVGEYSAILYHHPDPTKEEKPFFWIPYVLRGDMHLVFETAPISGVALAGSWDAKVVDSGCDFSLGAFFPGALGLVAPYPGFCAFRGATGSAQVGIPPNYLNPVVPLSWRARPQIFVAGLAHHDELELWFDYVEHEFGLTAKGVSALFTPVALVPMVIDFPIMNAEWFFTRVTKLSLPSVHKVKLPIKVENDKTVVEETFEREFWFPETKDRKAVRIRMKLHIRLCNGGC